MPTSLLMPIKQSQRSIKGQITDGFLDINAIYYWIYLCANDIKMNAGVKCIDFQKQFSKSPHFEHQYMYLNLGSRINCVTCMCRTPSMTQKDK